MWTLYARECYQTGSQACEKGPLSKIRCPPITVCPKPLIPQPQPHMGLHCVTSQKPCSSHSFSFMVLRECCPQVMTDVRRGRQKGRIGPSLLSAPNHRWYPRISAAVAHVPHWECWFIWVTTVALGPRAASAASASFFSQSLARCTSGSLKKSPIFPCLSPSPTRQRQSWIP